MSGCAGCAKERARGLLIEERLRQAELDRDQWRRLAEALADTYGGKP